MRYLMKMLSRALLALGAFMLPLAASAQDAAGDFVLLTEKDGPFGALAEEQDNLPMFLNTVYTLVIGIAVVLAVLQIVRGGILWMLTDSFTEKSQARHLITVAIMGLVLVLSPVIVFNIINPCILSLSLTGNAECEGSLEELQPDFSDRTDEGPPVPPEGIDLIPNGVYVRAKLFPASDDASLSAKLEEFRSQRCSEGDYEFDHHVVANGVLAVCRLETGFGLYMDFDGFFYQDNNPTIRVSNVTDSQKNATLISECSKLSSYGYAKVGLSEEKQQDFCGGFAEFGLCPSTLFAYGIDDSCQGGGHDSALDMDLNPLPPERTRICNYFEDDKWCRSSRDQ
ncbi:MAG: TrbC/VirB2 family protein [Candidatus Pacebacteria bacterium]|nr:TrbC/VirB2 family protein [Candidatus Paceibacterota bacterium]MBP9840094.1 TrbC/VirB2 family protein [Candidatus Paceibacterota bacterium]